MTHKPTHTALTAFSRRAALLGGATVALSGCGWLDWVWGEEPQIMAPTSLDYRLASGDKVKITVHREQDLSGEYLVDGAGMLSLAFLGPVKAGGLSARELEAVLTKRLAEGYLRKPQVAVEVMSHRPFYIYGELRSPGSYPFVPGMKMVNALVIGGGYTPRSRQGRFIVTRIVRGKKMEFDAADGDAVAPGDVIRIPERFF